MKKIGYISLLILLLLQSGGMLVIYKIRQVYIQYEMQAQLLSDKADFQKLRLSLQDYNKSKINSQEILFQGKMYDVKSKQIFNDYVELQVIHDEKEGEMLKYIRYLVNNTNQSDRKIPHQLLGIIFLLYVPADAVSFQDIVTTTQNINFNDFASLISCDSEIPSPPPRWV